MVGIIEKKKDFLLRICQAENLSFDEVVNVVMCCVQKRFFLISKLRFFTIFLRGAKKTKTKIELKKKIIYSLVVAATTYLTPSFHSSPPSQDPR